MFSRGILYLRLFLTENLNIYFTDSVSVTSAVPNVAVGADIVRHYPLPYPVIEYISQYVTGLNAYLFKMMAVGRSER